MVRLPILSRLRQTAPSMVTSASLKLWRALARQPHLRAQFSSVPRQWSYQSLRSATPEEGIENIPASAFSGVADTPANTDAASPLSNTLNACRYKNSTESPSDSKLGPILGRRRQIMDTLSRTTLGALTDSLSTYLPCAAHRRGTRHGDFLVHFGTRAQRPSYYLEDGTDNFHWPGEPWNSRVWAGGSIFWSAKTYPSSFEHPLSGEERSRPVPIVISRRLTCMEKITEVEHKGVVGSGREKVLIRTRRQYHHGKRLVQPDGRKSIITPAITEFRDLVFMPTKSAEEASAALARPDRIIKPTAIPDASISLTPRQPLLAEFSCLTHNAHRIHLDRGYAASEGFRNLVVHGPLSLYLMLTYLESVLPSHTKIFRFDYRNLAPLFCDEQMTICVRNASDAKIEAEERGEAQEHGGKEQTWDVWITGSQGGYAVKGTAIVRLNDPSVEKSRLTSEWLSTKAPSFRRTLSKAPSPQRTEKEVF